METNSSRGYTQDQRRNLHVTKVALLLPCETNYHARPFFLLWLSRPAECLRILLYGKLNFCILVIILNENGLVLV